MSLKDYDFFVCHASEDKGDVAEPLVTALRAQDYKVWFDKGQITVGDRLLRKINNGLSRSRFGVVILSHSFFAKNWTQWELEGMAAIEDAEGRKVILPVWHGVTKTDVALFAPVLAGRYATQTTKGLDAVIAELIAALQQADADEHHPLQQAAPVGEDEEPGPLDLWADAEENYEQGVAALREIANGLGSFTERAQAYNSKISDAASAPQRFSMKTVRKMVNEIVPVLDDYAANLTAHSDQMSGTFRAAFTQVARAIAMESGPHAADLKARQRKMISDIGKAASQSVDIMAANRESVGNLKGYSVELKRAKRRVITALDQFISDLNLIVQDAKDVSDSLS